MPHVSVMTEQQYADYVNARIAEQEPFGPAMKVDLTDFLREGENTLGVCCLSVAGPAAVMARLELEYAGGERQSLGRCLVELEQGGKGVSLTAELALQLGQVDQWPW